MYLFFGKKLLPLAVFFVNFGHPPARGHTGIMEGSLEPPVCLGIMCGGDCRSTPWNSILGAVLLCVSMLGAVVADGIVVVCWARFVLLFRLFAGVWYDGAWQMVVQSLALDVVVCCCTVG